MLQLALLACLHTPRQLTTNVSAPQETLSIQLETACLVQTDAKTALHQQSAIAALLLYFFKAILAKSAAMMASHLLDQYVLDAQLDASSVLITSSAITVQTTSICTKAIATESALPGPLAIVVLVIGSADLAMNLVKLASIIPHIAPVASTEWATFKLQLKLNPVSSLVLMVHLLVKEFARFATLDVPHVLDQLLTVFPALPVKSSTKEDAGPLALLFRCKQSAKTLHVLINAPMGSTDSHRLNVLHATLSALLAKELLTIVLHVFMDQSQLMVLVQSHVVKIN